MLNPITQYRHTQSVRGIQESQPPWLTHTLVIVFGCYDLLMAIDHFSGGMLGRMNLCPCTQAGWRSEHWEDRPPVSYTGKFVGGTKALS